MPHSLIPTEIALGFMPIILIFSVFLTVKVKPSYRWTDSGHEYNKAESPERQPLLLSRGFWLAFGALFGSAAVWALVQAVASAIEHGTISLPGTRGHPRLVVHWPAAWAYLCGTTFIVVATVLPRFARKDRLARAWLQLGSALLGTIGYLLVFLSPIFSSFFGVAIFSAAIGAVMVAFYVKRRLSQKSSRP